jgi:spermidine/putrescine transport system substrate-binding protein
MISRRALMGTAAATIAAAATLAVSPRARAAGDLHLLNWQGYGTDEAWALEAFKKKTGLNVVHDYFNSEQEMLTKLRTSPGAYDVVLINSTYTQQASAEGLIQPIDTSKVTNFGSLLPAMRDSVYLNTDGKTYGISWVWGMTGIAYNEDTVKPAPTSVEVLWDPKLAGRVCLRDDAIEVVSFAAIATGQDMNHPKDLDKIRAKLLALKPQVKTFWASEDEWNKFFAAKQFDVSTYWSGSAARSKTNSKLPVGFMIPKEGGIGWFDGLSVAKGAPNADGATAFIDYMVSPEFYYEWATKIGAPASANLKANETLPDGDVGKAIHGDAEAIKRLTYMAPLSDQERQAYGDLWSEVKTELAQ